MTTNQRRSVRLLAFLAAAGFALSACEYSETNGIGTRTADEEHPPQLDLASFDGCHRGTLGKWDASGTIVNNTETVSSYEVTIAFYADTARVAERSQWVRDLKPGEEALINGSWWVGESAEDVTSCEVLTINRFG